MPVWDDLIFPGQPCNAPVCEVNAVGAPSFPINLPAGGTVELCRIVVPEERGSRAVLLNAVVNWRATFTGLTTPVAIAVPGFVRVSFELLRNGGVVYRVIETANQAAPTIIGSFIGPTTTFVTTALLHLDAASLCGNSCAGSPALYTLRATNIIFAPPLFGGVPAATVSAAAGAVTLAFEAVETRRTDDADQSEAPKSEGGCKD